MAQPLSFDATADQIAALGDEDLRLLIAELCKVDLRQRWVPSSAVLHGGIQREPRFLYLGSDANDSDCSQPLAV